MQWLPTVRAVALDLADARPLVANYLLVFVSTRVHVPSRLRNTYHWNNNDLKIVLMGYLDLQQWMLLGRNTLSTLKIKCYHIQLFTLGWSIGDLSRSCNMSDFSYIHAHYCLEFLPSKSISWYNTRNILQARLCI